MSIAERVRSPQCSHYINQYQRQELASILCRDLLRLNRHHGRGGWWMRSFRVRQLAAAFVPASLLAEYLYLSLNPREHAREWKSGSKLPHSKASQSHPLGLSCFPEIKGSSHRAGSIECRYRPATFLQCIAAAAFTKSSMAGAMAFISSCGGWGDIIAPTRFELPSATFRCFASRAFC